MKNFLLSLYRIPTVDTLAKRELAEAERDLLKYEAKVEYDIAMRDMLIARVGRLKSMDQGL